MLLKCDVEVSNRLSYTQNARNNVRSSRGAIGLYKNNARNFSIVLFNNKHKTGFKYRVKENICQVFSRFVDTGRVTLSFKEPQHDISISKANPSDLKKLVHAVRLGCKGEDVPGIQFSKPGSIRDMLEDTKKEMKIQSRKDYPLTKPFPASLNKLLINDCGLVKFDCRILKLQNVSVLNLNNNKMSQLPDTLDSLVNLKELYLAKNNFINIPNVLWQSRLNLSLRLLDVSSNKLSQLPAQIGLLENLTNLRMDDNQITALPYSVGMLASLRYLSVAKNDLKILPYGFSKLNLDSLDVSGNPLDSEAANSLAFNQLVDVPSLFEIASRLIKDKSLKYSNEELPLTLNGYLDTAKICVCGKSCFQSYAICITMLDFGRVAHTITADILNAGRMSAPTEGYLCSKKCLDKWQRTLHVARR